MHLTGLAEVKVTRLAGVTGLAEGEVLLAPDALEVGVDPDSVRACPDGRWPISTNRFGDARKLARYSWSYGE